ncbi:MAG: PAS domain-containing protein [Acidimicrobiales bacterium]
MSTDDVLGQKVRQLGRAQLVSGTGSWEARLDGNGGVYWSDHVYALLKWSRRAPPTFDELIAMVHADDRDAFQHRRAQALAGEVPYDIRFRLVRPADGAVMHLRTVAQMFEAPDGRRLVGVLKDYTPEVIARRRVEQLESDRQEMLRRLFLDGDLSHADVAETLHDGPLHAVAAARLDLERAAADVSPTGVAAVERALGHLDRALRSIRTIEDVRPPPGSSAELRLALEEMAMDLAPELERRITVQLAWMPEASHVRAVLEIVHEACANARRHADAARLDVLVRSLGSAVEVTVRDDGHGFDPRDVDLRPGHLGITSMQERAGAVDGSLTIDSDAAGTTVRALLPRTPAASAK